jgi:hypothetical protein
MTVTILELPTTLMPIAQAPKAEPYTRLGPFWFTLTPIAKGIETYLAHEYGQRFLYMTALTTRLQIQEILELDNEK